MRILLTGAFGNIGQDVLNLLLVMGYHVRCFDVASERNTKIHRRFTKRPWDARRLETLWGDIRKYDDVARAVQDVDTIIHLAALIPPLSEKHPELAREINVGGTRRLIEAAQKADISPKFIFASSVSVYGPRANGLPPLRACDPVRPTDNYTRHKVECERLLQESGLPWVILRVAAVLISRGMKGFDPIIFRIPLDQRIELVHSRDVARACVNAITAHVEGRILLIGGGTGNQVLQREFFKGMMEAVGVGMLPESAFLVPERESDWYYTDFMDTEESQRLLHYQVHTFAEFIEELKESMGSKRLAVHALSPIIRIVLAGKSPYYKTHLSRIMKVHS